MTGPAEPIKVCLVTHRWAPEFSGAAHRFRQYLPGLRERGIEVDVLCSSAPAGRSPGSDGQWDDLQPGEIMGGDEVEGFPVYRVKLPAGASLRRNTLLRGAVARHLKATETDVAQFLTLEPFRTFPGGNLRDTGARAVFTGTQLWTFSRHRVKRALQRQWIRLPLQSVDRVVVSSVTMKEFYESLGVTAPIRIIPNGVDLRRFRSADPVGEKLLARRELSIPVGATVILFIGSIIYRKGVDVLIDAFARVASKDDEARLILVGPRAESDDDVARPFDRRVDQLVQASGAADRIRFTGYAPNVDTYFRAADVFVLPSRREGLGNVVLEAMAAGIPAVLTPYLGLPAEFGEAGTHYLLAAPDADSLASNISSLLQDPDRRARMAEHGRRRVTQHFSMSASIDAYAEIYRALAGHESARTSNRSVP